MPGIVPKVDNRLVQIMVIAQRAHRGRCQVEVAAFRGGEAKPAGREDAKNITMREEEHVARTRTDPGNHAVRAGAHRWHGCLACAGLRTRRFPLQ